MVHSANSLQPKAANSPRCLHRNSPWNPTRYNLGIADIISFSLSEQSVQTKHTTIFVLSSELRKSLGTKDRSELCSPIEYRKEEIMLFSSLIFIFLFLPLVLLAYFISPKFIKIYVLWESSLFKFKYSLCA